MNKEMKVVLENSYMGKEILDYIKHIEKEHNDLRMAYNSLLLLYFNALKEIETRTLELKEANKLLSANSSCYYKDIAKFEEKCISKYPNYSLWWEEALEEK